MASYSIYFDETGAFQGTVTDNFYAIFGLVWQGDADMLRDSLKKFCTDLADQLKNEGKDSGLPFPESLHTTSNRALKELLSEHDSDLIQARLKDLPLYVTGIYAYRKEVDPEDFINDDVYRKMIRTLIRQITAKIRTEDPEADITFHIPTRQTVFKSDEESKKHGYQQSNIETRPYRNDKTGDIDLRVSLNTSEAYYNLGRELDIHCPVRTISYISPDVDINDSIYHAEHNKESTLWGYYTADIINYWMLSLANRPDESAESIAEEIAAYLDVYLLLPFSNETEAARKAKEHVYEAPCEYLELLDELYSKTDPTPRTGFAIRMMENPNPFEDTDLIQTAVKQIEKHYIFETKYSKAKALLERLKALAEKAGNDNHYSYMNVIVKLMTCYHHEGGNRKAQELFDAVKNTLGNDRTNTLDICNKYQEFFVNTLAFEEGISFVEDVLEEYKPVTVRKKVGNVTISGADIPKDAKTILGRTTSSLGSLHAYLGHKAEAESLFQDAIRIFTELGDKTNTGITRSHYAHLLLDTEDIHSEKLLSVVNQYIAPENTNENINPELPGTWEKWMYAITQIKGKDGTFNPEYASFPFWIWLKAITKLPAEMLRANTEFHKILSKYPDHLKILELQDHPSEGIRKYLGIFSARINDQRSVKTDLEALQELIRLKQRGTIPLLCRKAIYDIRRELGTITEEETKSLEEGAAGDIEKLYDELHEATVETQLDTLIDRLHRRNPLKMSDLDESLRYEFR